MMEISVHYGKNDGNLFFSYFTVQRTFLLLLSESWPALSAKHLKVKNKKRKRL